jgi:hypothetical protein
MYPIAVYLELVWLVLERWQNTKAPEPVSSVTAVAKFELEGVARNVAIPEASPDTPVDIGKLVQLLQVARLRCT